MKTIEEDLGETASIEVEDMLADLVNVTINAARTSTDNEDFANYRRSLDKEYADSIYKIIKTYQRYKRRNK